MSGYMQFLRGMAFGRANPITLPSVTVTTAGVASQAVTLDNGFYDVLIEGATRELRRIFVYTGTYTITPANSDATFTKARFFGPYAFEANASTTVGASLKAGFVFNSKGVQACGGFAGLPSERLGAAVSTSPNLTPTHQGWCTDGTYYYTGDTATLVKRARADWSAVTTNATPFAGLAATPNHIGDIDVYNGELFAPMEAWAGSCGGSQGTKQIAVFDTSNLSLKRSIILSSLASTAEVSGIAVDGPNGIGYVTDYCAGLVRVINLTTGNVIGTISIPSAYSLPQGVALKNDQLWISCTHARSLNKVVMVMDLAGNYVRQLHVNSPPAGIDTLEGIGFDGNSLGLLFNDSTDNDPSYVSFWTPSLTVNNHTAGGFLTNLARAVELADLAPSNEFYLLLWAKPTTIFSFNEIWDSGIGSDGSKYESWIPAAGSVNGRAAAADVKTYTGPVSAGAELFYGFGHNQTSGATTLHVNGTDRVTTAGTATAWPAACNFVLGGGSVLNGPGDFLYRAAFLFNRIPTQAESVALQTAPGSILRPVNTISAAFAKTLLTNG